LAILLNYGIEKLVKTREKINDEMLHLKSVIPKLGKKFTLMAFDGA